VRRRDTFGLIALGAGPFQSLAAEEDWTPAVLTRDENLTVDRIADLIIPRTDTPGAHDVKVNRYIDEMLKSGVTAAERAAFLEGLQWLGEHCVKEFGRPFTGLDSKQQITVLTRMSESSADDHGRQFFVRMKDMTLHGYYSSRDGLLLELEYKGNRAYAEYPGCTHPEHHQ
jgi:hypothetical protein